MSMFSLRRLGLLVASVAAAAILAGPAGAARPAGSFPELIVTDHFQVHYTGLLAAPDRTTQQKAGDLAANAERAYALFVTSWGYPAPLNDGDGKIDIWVQDLQTATPGLLGLATMDVAGSTGTGWIAVDSTVVTSLHVIAHEVLHLFQFAQWRPADDWLLEATAEWGGLTAASYVPVSGTIASSVAEPELSLDCVGDHCGDDTFASGGYSRWAFFQYAAERFGNTFVKDVFAKGAALADPTKKGAALLAATLVDKGTTLGDVFNDATRAHVAGAYLQSDLKGRAPATFSTTQTGSASGALPVQQISVNHLAARYLKFTRGAAGEAGATTPCYAATLSLTVALPPGSTGSRPSFSSSSLGAAAIPLTVSGTTAALTVPWNTCADGAAGYLALPNPSLTADAQLFTVSGSLSVDPATGAGRVPPPAAYTGAASPPISGDVAPSILVYGAQTLRVSAANRLARLIVFASGPGKLRASIGGKLLGTVQLRAGNNDVRFKLPAATLSALRVTAGARASSSLTLTSLSTTGATGQSVSRKVSVVKQGARA
jgi:hypothetical protein